MRRRHRRSKSNNVELNLAAMLDMAFQILAFFILTFRPAPIEGHLQMHLPPPVALTKVDVQNAQQTDGPGVAVRPPGIETVDIFITADSQGDVATVSMGLRTIVQGRLDRPSLAYLNEELGAIFNEQALLYDRVQLVVDGRLRYEELMKIVDVCTRQKLSNGQPLQRISFIEMDGEKGQ